MSDVEQASSFGIGRDALWRSHDGGGDEHVRHMPRSLDLAGCRTRRNLTGGSQPRIMRGLAQARRLMLAARIDEALGAIERIERQLDDVPPAAAQRFRAAVQLLRAAGLAFLDNGVAARSIALSHPKGNGVGRDERAAATLLCRLGCWQLLRRAHVRCGTLGAADSEVLPILGSPLSQWEARHAERQSAQPANRAGDTLSARECEILGLIGEGFPNKRIARALAISPETVKSHVKRIFRKLAAGTRAEAVCRARSLGLL